MALSQADYELKINQKNYMEKNAFSKSLKLETMKIFTFLLAYSSSNISIA